MALKYEFRLTHREIVDLWATFEFAYQFGYRNQSLRNLRDVLNDFIAVIEMDEFE